MHPAPVDKSNNRKTVAWNFHSILIVPLYIRSAHHRARVALRALWRALLCGSIYIWYHCRRCDSFVEAGRAHKTRRAPIKNPKGTDTAHICLNTRAPHTHSEFEFIPPSPSTPGIFFLRQVAFALRPSRCSATSVQSRVWCSRSCSWGQFRHHRQCYRGAVFASALLCHTTYSFWMNAKKKDFLCFFSFTYFTFLWLWLRKVNVGVEYT